MKKVLIAGGTGLIGQQLINHFSDLGYKIHILSRKHKEDTEHVKFFRWDLHDGSMDTTAIDVDLIINLAGAGIADKRWSDTRKSELIESRTKSVSLIEKTLRSSNHKVKHYIGASAIGFYGDRGSEVLTEDSKPGKGFLSECCQKWEEAHSKIQELVDHFTILRIGIVLSNKGGALPKMLMTKSIGVFNYFGSGLQMYSWIHIDDMARIFIFISEHKHSGIFNATAPHPLPNKEMMKQLISNTKLKGILVPAPAFALRLAMGEMSAVVLDSCHVSSRKLQDADFEFLNEEVWQVIE